MKKAIYPALACLFVMAPSNSFAKDITSLDGESPPRMLGKMRCFAGWISSDATEGIVGLSGDVGLPWEADLHVHKGSIVPTPGQLFSVEYISPPARHYSQTPVMPGSGMGTHGSIGFAPIDGKSPATEPHVAVISKDEPTTFGITDAYTRMQIIDLAPDETHPKTATIEWWKDNYRRQDITDKEVQTLEVKKGTKIVTPRVTVTVVAIEGATSTHPAWITVRKD